MTKQRIIPADAGSTKQYPKVVTEKGDHPRGCGEHFTNGMKLLKLAGSSPRMRGAPWCRLWEDGRPRIIPADAGSTPRWAARSRPCTDHPRGCGEHSFKAPICRFSSGSSPRMRGAPQLLDLPVHVEGIIPADAGSTSSPLPKQ